MSRNIEVDTGLGLVKETIESMTECRWLVNNVCTNDRCQECCDFPHPDYCAKVCSLFEKEDGIITN